MLASMLLTAAIWPSAVTEYCSPLDKTLMVGVAKSTNGDFLYCELVDKTSQYELRIDYVKDKKVFASKELKYTTDTTMPAVLQKDFRFGEIRQAEIAEEKITLYYQASSDKRNSSASIARKDVDVIDAGFDNYVRNHWEELQSGKTLAINFASMAHLKALPLRIVASRWKSAIKN